MYTQSAHRHSASVKALGSVNSGVRIAPLAQVSRTGLVNQGLKKVEGYQLGGLSTSAFQLKYFLFLVRCTIILKVVTLKYATYYLLLKKYTIGNSLGNNVNNNFHF